MSLRVGLAATVLIWAQAGCEPADPPEPPAESRAQFVSGLEQIEVTDDTVAVVGVNPQREEDALAQVTWAAITPDSILVLGDPIIPRVAAFSLDGDFVRNLGRVGEGPGEFLDAHNGGLTAKGDVWVHDLKRRRVVVYASTGDALASVDLSTVSLPAERSTVFGVDSSFGVWLEVESRMSEARRRASEGAPVRDGERFRSATFVFRVTDDSSELVWSGEGTESVYEVSSRGAGAVSSFLAPKLLTTLVGESVVMTRSDSAAILRLDASGGLTPWLTYPPSAVPSGDSYPSVTGAQRYPFHPESHQFIPGDHGSKWLEVRNPSASHPDLLQLKPAGFSRHLTPGEMRGFILFIGEVHGVVAGLTPLGEPIVTVHRLSVSERPEVD